MANQRMVKKNADKISLPRSIQKLFPHVKTAFDADVSVEILVSARDCREAKEMDPTNCALARAAKRELHADGVVIGMSSSYIIKDDMAVRFQTPESVRREIVSFDRHGDFALGNYHLVPKAPANRLGSHYGGSRTNPNKKVRRKMHRSSRVRLVTK